MSTMINKMFYPLPSDHVPELRRQVWGRLFGLGVHATRTEAGLSIEQAADLAGMKISEWMAIEEGYVPWQAERLQAIAAVLEISFERVMNWVFLCREAWEM